MSNAVAVALLNICVWIEWIELVFETETSSKLHFVELSLSLK